MPFALGNRLTAAAIYILFISGGQRPDAEQLARLTERAHGVIPDLRFLPRAAV